METTYKIIGADGREYGPVPIEELRRWIREGRVAMGTQVWRSDLASWAHASTYAEIVAELPKGNPAEAALIASMTPVGFFARAGAYIIDWILLSVVLGIFFAPLSGKFHQALQSVRQALESPTLEFEALLGLVGWLFVIASIQGLGSFLYFVGMNGKWGATLGKMAVGAKIVNQDGSRLGFRRAFWRYGAEVISWVVLGIGYLMIGLREDKRGLHDLIAKTRVIYRD